jgi:plastocyanin
MRSIHSWFGILILVVALAPEARAESKKKPAAATKADVERLEKKVEEQQKQIDRLVKVQQQYFQAIKALFDSPVTANDAKPDDAKVAEPKPVVVEAKPELKIEPKPVAAPTTAASFTDTKKVKVEPKPKKLEKPEGAGTIVGKVTGASDAVIYVDDIVASTRGTATMKQEGKQFLPKVLIVQKGTTVSFPNMDAIFHNVFSVTPDRSFDLGSYPQGESKSVTMTKSGVVSVYCNMHPQMVGHILVVPNGNYVRVGKDGFFRLTNVPAGKHRVVAWAPNAKPVEAEAEVSDTGVVTLELELKKGRVGAHTKKDGLPYGSYAE